MTTRKDETLARVQALDNLAGAVLYAMRCGCFFPVPEPQKGAPVEDWIRWGAIRNLHDKVEVARLTAERDSWQESAMIHRREKGDAYAHMARAIQDRTDVEIRLDAADSARRQDRAALIAQVEQERESLRNVNPHQSHYDEGFDAALAWVLTLLREGQS